MDDLAMLRARVAADTDQDIEEAKRWIRDLSQKSLIKFWLYMNQEFRDLPTEYMSRLAMIGFCVVLEALYAQNDDQSTAVPAEKDPDPGPKGAS